MIPATLEDESLVIAILTSSFDTNKSVDYIIKRDKHRTKRLQFLMEYAFHLCLQSGEVFLSDDRKGCALVLYPDKKRTSFQSIVWDVRLALFAVGIRNISKTLKKESEIKKRHPAGLFSYLWFIGVSPEAQGTGTGTVLLNQVIKHANDQHRGVVLETSTAVNLPWYEKRGFEKYDELDLGYSIFLLKHA